MFPPPAFRQNTHGIQMTSIKKRRSPDDELLYLPVSLSWAFRTAAFPPSLSELLLCGRLLMVCDNEIGVMVASEIRQNVLFAKSGNYPFPSQFWNILVVCAPQLITHPVKATLLIEFFLVKYLK